MSPLGQKVHSMDAMAQGIGGRGQTVHIADVGQGIGGRGQTVHILELTFSYMMSFLIQRSDTAYGSGIVPRGTDDGGATYSDTFNWLGGTLIYPQTPLSGYPMDVAFLEVGPEHVSWIWGPSLAGTSRPTGFHLILTGATGPPVYLGDYPTTPGYTPSLPLTDSPTLDAPDDGIMFCLAIGLRAGDVGIGPFIPIEPPGVVELRQTMASDGPVSDPGATYPNSILVYKAVAAGETVTFTFEDSGTKQYVNTLVVFVPGADWDIEEFTHSGSVGGGLGWSW